MVNPVNVKEALPVFVNVTHCGLLVVPTWRKENANCAGETPAAGPFTPVPPRG